MVEGGIRTGLSGGVVVVPEKGFIEDGLADLPEFSGLAVELQDTRCALQYPVARHHVVFLGLRPAVNLYLLVAQCESYHDILDISLIPVAHGKPALGCIILHAEDPAMILVAYLVHALNVCAHLIEQTGKHHRVCARGTATHPVNGVSIVENGCHTLNHGRGA